MCGSEGVVEKFFGQHWSLELPHTTSTWGTCCSTEEGTHKQGKSRERRRGRGRERRLKAGSLIGSELAIRVKPRGKAG
jgi:hypothetical protein